MYKLKLRYEDKKREKFIKILAYIGAGLDYMFNPVRWYYMFSKDYNNMLRVADQCFMRIIDGEDSMESYKDACTLEGIRQEIYKRLDSEETVMKVFDMLLDEESNDETEED